MGFILGFVHPLRKHPPPPSSSSSSFKFAYRSRTRRRAMFHPCPQDAGVKVPSLHRRRVCIMDLTGGWTAGDPQGGESLPDTPRRRMKSASKAVCVCVSVSLCVCVCGRLKRTNRSIASMQPGAQLSNLPACKTTHPPLHFKIKATWKWTWRVVWKINLLT